LCNFINYYFILENILKIFFENFRSNIAAIANINTACPNIAYWYQLAKQTSTYSNLVNSTGALTELGTILSGISAADLMQINSNSISFITATAFTFMPASTVNMLTNTQLAGLTLSQAVALQNSPYYTYFSNAIQSVIQSIINNSKLSAVSSASIQHFNIYNLIILLFIVLVQN
jgi:hypothetical protein